MSNHNEKDYSNRVWISAFALILVLVVVAFIPPQKIGGVELRRASILSQIAEFEQDKLSDVEEQAELHIDDVELDMDKVAASVASLSKVDSIVGVDLANADSVNIDTISSTKELPRALREYEWDLRGEDLTDVATLGCSDADSLAQVDSLEILFVREPAGQITASAITPIVRVDSVVESPLVGIYNKILDGERVRIAVFGDSFTELDIITSSMRERLQQQYGGGGVGFAPMSSPLAVYRQTIKTKSSGWQSHSLMQRKSASPWAMDNFYVSGWVSTCDSKAQTRWQMGKRKIEAEEPNLAEVYFLAPNDCSVELVLNDTISKGFEIVGDSLMLRRLVVRADAINSLEFRIQSGFEGFLGYGATFEREEGVNVDNYSVRSNSGQAMFWTNPQVNAQFNNMRDYDLIILQYGLNILQGDVMNYRNYGEQVEKMIAFVRECFPSAQVMIFGVSDRGQKSTNGFESMASAAGMSQAQRSAALNQGAMFWSIRDAMIERGGISRFVANGWAAKDYTHIGHGGGRQIADAFVDALNQGVREQAQSREQEYKRQQLAREQAEMMAQRVDSLFVNSVLVD